VLAEYLKYEAFEGIVISFREIWMILNRAGCCGVAFGGCFNCACVPHHFQQLINTMLCPVFS